MLISNQGVNIWTPDGGIPYYPEVAIESAGETVLRLWDVTRNVTQAAGIISQIDPVRGAAEPILQGNPAKRPVLTASAALGGRACSRALGGGMMLQTVAATDVTAQPFTRIGLMVEYAVAGTNVLDTEFVTNRNSIYQTGGGVWSAYNGLVGAGLAAPIAGTGCLIMNVANGAASSIYIRRNGGFTATAGPTNTGPDTAKGCTWHTRWDGLNWANNSYISFDMWVNGVISAGGIQAIERWCQKWLGWTGWVP